MAYVSVSQRSNQIGGYTPVSERIAEPKKESWFSALLKLPGATARAGRAEVESRRVASLLEEKHKEKPERFTTFIPPPEEISRTVEERIPKFVTEETPLVQRGRALSQELKEKVAEPMIRNLPFGVGERLSLTPDQESLIKEKYANYTFADVGKDVANLGLEFTINPLARLGLTGQELLTSEDIGVGAGFGFKDAKTFPPSVIGSMPAVYKFHIDEGDSPTVAALRTGITFGFDVLIGFGIAEKSLPAVRASVRQLPQELLFKIKTEKIPVDDIIDTLLYRRSPPEATKFIQGLSNVERKALRDVANAYKEAGGQPVEVTERIPTKLGEFVGLKSGKAPTEIRPAAQLPGYVSVEERGFRFAPGLKIERVKRVGGEAEIPKELQPLAAEARKYKSAEEFVKGQQKVFRGGSSNEITEKGLSVSTNENVAKTFALARKGTVGELYISPNAKIVDIYDIPTLSKDKAVFDYNKANPPLGDKGFMSAESKYQIAAKWAKDNGYDAVKLPTEGEIRVVNPDILKTKSQLTDFYNQAVKAKIPLKPPTKAEELRSIQKEIKKGIEEGFRPIKEAEIATREAFEKSIEKGLKEAKFGKKPTTIVKREDLLLRQSIKKEARIAKEVASNVRQKTRNEVLDQLRTKQENIQKLKEAIIQYAKGTLGGEGFEIVKPVLPLSERGKLLSMVKDAKTQRDVIKAFTRIDRIAQEVEKKGLISAIKKELKKTSDSPSIAVDYKAKIKELTEGFDLVNRREATLEKLKASEEFFAKQKEAGKDVLIPEQLVKQLKILSKKPISELSVAEIRELLGKIQDLQKLGETKLRTMENLYEIEKARKLAELKAEIVPIEKHPLIEAGVGEKLSTKEKFRNILPKLLNGAQHIDLSITPMDVFFDLLGGADGSYAGAPYRIFKKTTDLNYQRYLDQKDKLTDAIWNKADELGLDTANFEKIGIHAARVQKDGIEKLVNTGLTPEEINAVTLTDKEMDFYNFMRKNLDELRSPVAEVMRTVYNKELGQVENYFSFVTDWKAMTDTEVFQRIGEGVQEFGRPTKEVEKGFTIERTGVGKQKIKIDAMEVYLKHIDNVSYLLNMARDNRMLFEIANSKEFGEIAGEVGQNTTLEWVDVISRKGGRTGDQQIAFLDALRRNVGIARLGFKLSSAIIQPTALMDGASLIDGWAFKGARDVLSRGDIRKFIMDNMPEIRDRVGDDRAFTELSENAFMAKIQEAGYAPLKMLDEITASAVGWGAYLQKLKELGVELDLAKPNAEALDYAQKIVRRTQASALFKDAPLAVSRGKLTGNRSFDRALFQFQTFMLNRWSLIRHDLYRAGIKHKNFRKAFNIFFWIMISTLTEEGLRRGSKELIDLATGRDDSKDDGYTEAVARSVLTTVPFVSQAVSIAVYDSDPIPALGAFEGIAGIPQLVTGKTAQTKMRGLINLSETAGAVLGIPGSTQVAQFGRGVVSESKKGGTVGAPLDFGFGGKKTLQGIAPLNFNF